MYSSVSTSFTSLLLAMRTSTVATTSKFAFIVFNIKRSSFSVVWNKGRPTSRLTDWVNGTQNSRLVDIVHESRLLFVPISSIYRKKAAKAWNWVSTKWNTNFWLENSVRKNRTTFSDVPLLPEVFRWSEPNSRALFPFQPDFPETFCKW